MNNRKGVTLVEVLAVIVILGILITIGTISVSSMISNSRKQTFIDSARNFIAATRQLAAENPGRFYPQDSGASNIVFIKDLSISGSGATKSPYNCDYDYAKSFVRIENTRYGYDFYIALVDVEGHALATTDGTNYYDIKENELNVNKIKQVTSVNFTLDDYGIVDLSVTPSTKACVLLGDVNGDKVLNNDDYNLCLRIANGSYQVNEAEYNVLTRMGIYSDYHTICGYINSKTEGYGTIKVDLNHNMDGFAKFYRYSEADC